MASLAELMVSIGADISGFTRSMSTVQNSMNQTGNRVSRTMGGASSDVGKASGNIMSSVKKMAGVVGGAFALKEAFDFGKGAIEASASLQAMDAQFEQVFGKMQGEAQKNIDGMANEFGMLPNRIKPMYSSVTSMFLGLGATTKEAMTGASDAVKIASDASAFYDKSLEDTSASLNSFIKGNYEGGESIGLFANETQMADWASQNLSMSWKDATEKEKQLARLEFAKAMQEKAGATGQASREADNYENRVGNLKQAWTELKARMADPFLNVVTDAMAGLTTVITKVDFSKIGSTFTSLMNKFDKSTGVVGTWKEMFNTIKPLVQDAIGGVVSFVGSKLDVLKKFWEENGDQILKAIGNAMKGVKAVFDFVLPAILFVVDFVWSSIKGVITGALDVIMGAVKIFSGLFTGDFDKMWEGVKQLFSGAIKLIWNLMNLSFVGGIKKLVLSLGKNFLKIIVGLWDDVALRFMYGKDAVVKLIGALKNKGVEIFNGIKTGLVNIVKNLWSGIKTVFTTLKNTVVNLFTGLHTNAVSIWSSIKTSLGNIVSKLWNALKTTFTNSIGTLKTKVSGFKDDLVKKFGDIKDKVVGKVKDMAKEMKDKLVGGIDDLVEKAKGIPKKIGDGIVEKLSDVKSGIGELANTIIDKFKSALGIHSPSKVFEKLGGFVVAGLKNGLTSSNVKEFAGKLFNKVTDGALKTWENVKGFFSGFDSLSDIKGMFGGITGKIGDFFKGMFDGGGGKVGKAGKGVEQWRGIATQALIKTGQYSPANLERLLYQMSTESGGNARAINLWDSNAKKGTPSKGLMQVIDPTFRAYAMKGYDKDVYDPMSNIIASIRYAVSRYGSLAKAYKGVGYAKGGILSGTGMGSLVRMAENGRSEAIVPIQHKRYMAPFARAIVANMPQDDERVNTQGTVNYEFTIPVVVDGREIARATASFTQEELDRLAKRKNRLEGTV